MTLMEDVQVLRSDLDKLDQAFATDVKAINERLTRIEQRFGEWTAVAAASQRTAEELSKKGVTTKQFVIGILGLALPFVILAITLALTSHS